MKHYRSEVWEMVLIGFHQLNLSLSVFMLKPARFKHINLLLIISIANILTCESGEITVFPHPFSEGHMFQDALDAWNGG